MANRGLSEHLIAFIRGGVFRKLKNVYTVLDGRAFGSAPSTRRATCIWAQIDENRRIFGVMKELAPDVLAQDPSLEQGFAHLDVYLTDLAVAAELRNPWALTAAEGFPRPWPGAEILDSYGWRELEPAVAD